MAAPAVCRTCEPDNAGPMPGTQTCGPAASAGTGSLARKPLDSGSQRRPGGTSVSGRPSDSESFSGPSRRQADSIMPTNLNDRGVPREPTQFELEFQVRGVTVVRVVNSGPGGIFEPGAFDGRRAVYCWSGWIQTSVYDTCETAWCRRCSSDLA
jgi:hypothetical protein